MITTRDYGLPARGSATEYPRLRLRSSAIAPAPVALQSSGCPDRPQEAPLTMGRARTLAFVYRRFAEADDSATSPLHKRIALALSESDEALRATRCCE